MIRHIVLFKLRPGHAAADPLVRRAAEATARLGETIEDIDDWIFGPNTVDRSDAYDFAAIAVFADADALVRYQRHPAHQAAVQEWDAISDRVVADLNHTP